MQVKCLLDLTDLWVNTITSQVKIEKGNDEVGAMIATRKVKLQSGGKENEPVFSAITKDHTEQRDKLLSGKIKVRLFSRKMHAPSKVIYGLAIQYG